MSIAVSAIVRPSKLLVAAVTAMSFGALVIGIAIVTEQIGYLPFVSRVSVSAFSVFLAFFGFYHGISHRKTIQLDIAGTGQFRLSELQLDGACAATNWPHVKSNGEVFRLLKDSTIWPHLLLLRLQADGGKITTLPILPDCVSRDSFRALSVACRWIANRNPQTESDF